MPFYKAPRSDLKRLAFLQRAAQTGADDILAGRMYLAQATVDALEDQITPLAISYQLVSVRRGERKAAVDQGEARLATPQALLRDLWETIRRRVKRDGEPASVLGYYQLPGNGNSPKPGSRDAWISLAEAVIAGDAQAVLAGFPATTLPSILEVQTALSDLNAAIALVQMTDRAYDLAQAAIAELRPAADALIDDVMAELRYNLRSQEAPSFRRIARTYGAEYGYNPGETPEDDLPPLEQPLPPEEPVVQA